VRVQPFFKDRQNLDQFMPAGLGEDGDRLNFGRHLWLRRACRRVGHEIAMELLIVQKQR
jgi:hypothetical protein